MVPTSETAALFTKLTAAGFSVTDALARIAPQYHASLTAKALTTWENAWCSHRIVVDAVDQWNHGPWHELPLDDRIEKAREHHHAQLALLLYTSDYLAPGADLGRIRDARKALTEYVAEKQGGREDIYAKALREILEGKAKASGPPQMAGDSNTPHEKIQEKISKLLAPASTAKH